MIEDNENKKEAKEKIETGMEIETEEAVKEGESGKEGEKEASAEGKRAVEAELEEKPQEVFEDRGIDYEALSEEFQARGDLSESTRKKLSEQGITGEILDNYIEGQKAIIQKQLEEISESVGGMERMAMIVEWARSNLSEEEKKSIDRVHDKSVIKIILKDLESRMRESEGYLPEHLQGRAGAIGGDYFESMSEVEEAINDSRYAKDAIYRRKVAEKITRSREAGILKIA